MKMNLQETELENKTSMNLNAELDKILDFQKIYSFKKSKKN